MSLGRVQLGGPEGLMLREQLEEEVEVEVEGTQQDLQESQLGVGCKMREGSGVTERLSARAVGLGRGRGSSWCWACSLAGPSGGWVLLLVPGFGILRREWSMNVRRPAGEWEVVEGKPAEVGEEGAEAWRRREVRAEESMGKFTCSCLGLTAGSSADWSERGCMYITGTCHDTLHRLCSTTPEVQSVI